MCITKKQKEREIVPLPPNSCTKSYSHVSYKYRSLHLFLYRAPSLLFSLIISLSSGLLCFLYYGWFTLIYFLKFSFSKEVEVTIPSEGAIEPCLGREVAIDEVNGDFCTGNNIVLNEGEVEEKEIMEIEKMAEAHIEEEPIFYDEKTTDLLKPEVQGCQEVSLMRPPPWWSLCGLLEVLIQQKDTK